jgi:hypothetical protein
MRSRVLACLLVPLALAGCPALLSDWTVASSGGNDASADAQSPDGNSSSSSSGSTSGSSSGTSSSEAGSSSGSSGGSNSGGSSSSSGSSGSSGGSTGGTDAGPDAYVSNCISNGTQLPAAVWSNRYVYCAFDAGVGGLEPGDYVPAECRCVNTFQCACLQAYGNICTPCGPGGDGIDNGRLSSCVDTDAGPTATCR